MIKDKCINNYIDIIKIDNIYKWLFGVPNQHGFLFYRTEYNRVYLPERTPMKVVCLIKEILGIEE